MQQIIKLFQNFDKYKDSSYQELYYHILPSINLQQYKVFKDERGLYAFVNWAKLDNKDEYQYSQTGLLYKNQWNSGKNIWLYDIVIIRKAKEVMRWVYNYFKGYLETNQSIKPRISLSFNINIQQGN